MMKYLKYALFAILLTLVCCEKPAPPKPDPDPKPDPTEYDSGISGMDDATLGSEETLLVSQVCLPESFAGVLHDDVLEISARGFKNGDRIFFVSADGVEMAAQPVSASTDRIRFRLPAQLVSGDWTLYLSRGEKCQQFGMRVVICDTPSSMVGVNVHGKVTSSGKALARVPVSDGYAITVTDASGEYNLVSGKKNGYVFITCPGNARPATVDNIPQSFAYLGEVEDVDVADFELEDVDNSRHRIIFITDLHISNYTNNDLGLYKSVIAPEVRAAVDASGGPAYIFIAGDSTTDHRWYSFNFALPEWKALAAETLNAPLYQCMGNHDNEPYSTTDFTAESVFKQVIGPSWWSVNIGDIHYVILDNIVYGVEENEKGDTYFEAVTQQQRDWIRRDLMFVDKDTPVVVLMHSPLYHYVSPTALTPHFPKQALVQEVLDCFEGYKCVHFVSGHKHTNHNIEISSMMMEHNIAASSGCNWFSTCQTAKHYSRDGSRGCMQIWDMNSRDIRWVHKAPGSPISESQFHVLDLNCVPAEKRGDVPANSVLVNIYNWDVRWQLSIRENGRELPWTQVYRLDPLFDIVCPDQVGSTVKTPTTTEHIFIATASAPDTPVTVMVKDRFGVTYNETVERPRAFDLSNIK